MTLLNRNTGGDVPVRVRQSVVHVDIEAARVSSVVQVAADKNQPVAS